MNKIASPRSLYQALFINPEKDKMNKRKLKFKINATGWQRRSLIGKPIENLLNRFDFPIAYGFLSKSGIYTSLEIELECSDQDFIKVDNRVSRMLLKYQVLRAD